MRIKNHMKLVFMFLLLVVINPIYDSQSETAVNNNTSSLPSTITLCGVFPIAMRPDAGPDRRDGFLMAIDEINGQTGSTRILPAGVTLVGDVKDDLNSASGGTSAANACVSDNADLVIGSSGSTVSVAMANVLTPLNIIQISYASSSPVLSNRTTYPYFMRNVASDADQGIALADLVASFGWIHGATINTDDSYGTGLVSYFTANFQAASSSNSIDSAQTFAPGATDVSAQVQAIANSNPQFVLLHAIDIDAKTVFKKGFDLGIAGDNSDIVWIITDGSSSTATFAGDANVQKSMQYSIGTTPSAITQSYYADFNSSWWSVTSCGTQTPCGASRTNLNANSYTPFAYDAVYIAAKGIAAADTVAHDATSAQILLDALYKVSFTGAGGVVKFNSRGEVDGRYDYVTLNGNTFSTFGTWQGTRSFSWQQMILTNGRVYDLDSNNNYIFQGEITTSTIPGSSSSSKISSNPSLSSTSLPVRTSTIPTTPFDSNYFIFAIFLLITLNYKRRSKL